MIIYINTNRLLPHPKNPRQNLGELTELADNIRINGIYQNLTVVPVDAALYQKKIASKKAYTGDYVIVIGHRRHAAAKMAALSEVPCVVALMDEKTQLSTMMCENIQRSDLTLYEQAQGFQLMLDLGETTSSISELTGLSKTTISKRVKLLALDSEEFQKAEERGATLDDFVKLANIKDVSLKNEVLEHAGTNNFNWKLNNALYKEKQVKETPCKASGKKTEPVKVTAQSQIQIDNQKALSELSTRAYELRLNFIKNYRPEKKHLKNIIAFATNAMLIADYPDNDVFNILFGDMDDVEVNFDILEGETNSKPEYILTATAYSTFEHSYNNYLNKNCVYKNNAELDMIYSFLEAVGYQMSDVEKQLKDGTHELYAKE
jgi:ParB family chromosome partitioning protein